MNLELTLLPTKQSVQSDLNGCFKESGAINYGWHRRRAVLLFVLGFTSLVFLPVWQSFNLIDGILYLAILFVGGVYFLLFRSRNILARKYGAAAWYIFVLLLFLLF